LCVDGPAILKRRYVTFDALRGVAAIVVVLGHVGEQFHTWQPAYFFLAVDLFFMLSGFVLAINYDKKFAAGMTAFEFMRVRAVRLWPLALIGAVLGLASQIIAPVITYTSLQAVVSFLLTCMALPTPPNASHNILFPMNSAYWSLFLEFWVANLVLGLFWRTLQGRLLFGLIFISVIGLLWSERHFYQMNTGWGWHNVTGGGARLAFSFFIGVALARLPPAYLARLQIPSWLCIAVMTAAFFIPVPGRLGHIVNLGYILFLLPTVIYFGANAKENNPKLGVLLGDASYALYTIHIPLIVMLAKPLLSARIVSIGVNSLGLIVITIIFMGSSIGLALLLDRQIDRPFRSFLLRLASRQTAAYSGVSES